MTPPKTLLVVQSTTMLSDEFDMAVADAVDRFTSEHGWTVGQVVAALAYNIAITTCTDDEVACRQNQVMEAITLINEIWSAKLQADFGGGLTAH